MSGLDRAGPNVDRGAIHFVDLKEMEAVAGTDNVRDGIDCADFMEVNLFNRDAVDCGFCFSEDLEDSAGGGFDGGGDLGLVD